MLAEDLLESAAPGLHAGGCGTEVKISVYQAVDRGEGKPPFFRKSSVIGNDGKKDGHSLCVFLQAGRRMGQTAPDKIQKKFRQLFRLGFTQKRGRSAMIAPGKDFLSRLKGDALNGAGQAVRKLSPAQHVRDALRGGG